MYCKYCGKKLDGAMEVCTECEEKLLKGENPFFSVPVYRDPVKQLKQSLAAQNTPEQASASNEQPGVQTEQNIVEGEQPPVEAEQSAVQPEQSAVQPEQNVVNQIRSPETRTYLGNQSQLPQQKKDFYGNGYDKSPYTAPSPYTSRSGIAFGVLSIVLPWAGWITFIFTLLALLDSGYGNGPTGVIVLLSILVAPFVLSLVFGIKAIKTFKKARIYGVRPVAALVLGIIGLAESGSIVLAILECL